MLDAILRIVGVKVRFLLELVRLLLLLPLPSLLLLRVLLVLSFVRRPTVPSADPSRAASGSGTRVADGDGGDGDGRYNITPVDTRARDLRWRGSRRRGLQGTPRLSTYDPVTLGGY